MKNLFNLNLFIIGAPIVMCLMGFLDENFLLWGLLSTMLTGLFQVVFGIAMLIDEPKNKHLQLYFSCVILFFCIWLTSLKFGYVNFGNTVLFTIPPCLALYLTVIIYKKIEK